MISHGGGSLGAIIAPLVVVVVPVAAACGWRTALLITGALGVRQKASEAM